MARYWNSGTTPAGHVAVACSAMAWPTANTAPAAGVSSVTAVHDEVFAISSVVSVLDVKIVVVPCARTRARNWCVPSGWPVVVKSADVAVLKFLNVVNVVVVPTRCCHWISGVLMLQLAVAVRWIAGPIIAELGPEIVMAQNGEVAATTTSAVADEVCPSAP